MSFPINASALTALEQLAPTALHKTSQPPPTDAFHRLHSLYVVPTVRPRFVPFVLSVSAGFRRTRLAQVLLRFAPLLLGLWLVHLPRGSRTAERRVPMRIHRSGKPPSSVVVEDVNYI